MVEELERGAIEETLRLSANDLGHAAQRLGVDKATLITKMKAYHIPFDGDPPADSGGRPDVVISS
ncbi:MAG: helix-turn-helix domain-containing protein [Chloroflexi bacterium]|nr:helix-turn-helix domain-containing protein [Chloroflexota bacterium]